MQIVFDDIAEPNEEVSETVNRFLQSIPTLEGGKSPIFIVHQDGRSGSYYIRCSISSAIASPLVDFDARLIPESPDSFRANRELLLKNNAYLRMRSDAEKGREFSDIIVEYNLNYSPDKPLKVWGGQHRSHAIKEVLTQGAPNRFHGYRVYFGLSKDQRADLALTSNTNINVSNDLFDRQIEETMVGPELRKWCVEVGLLLGNEDFPDVASRSERITVQLARTFIVNFYKGAERGQQLTPDHLDMNVYEPYLCSSGTTLDESYRKLVEHPACNIWKDEHLKIAGQAFSTLHKAQYNAIRKSKSTRRSFRTKALTASVLSGWSYVAGLLQNHPERLNNHLVVPQPPKGVADPLNASEMSVFKHEEDAPTYRGLGTRSALKDRQRMAQVFLARSTEPNLVFQKSLLQKAVSQVVGLKALQRGYTG